MYALTEDIKKKKWKEEEAVLGQPEEVAERVSRPSEREHKCVPKNLKINTFKLPMQKCKIFSGVPRRTSTIAKVYRSQDLAKAVIAIMITLDVLLPLRAWLMMSKKGLEMVQESLVHALKEEGIEEIKQMVDFDHNFHMAIQTMPADDEHPADTIAQDFSKGYKLNERVLRPAIVVVYN